MTTEHEAIVTPEQYDQIRRGGFYARVYFDGWVRGGDLIRFREINSRRWSVFPIVKPPPDEPGVKLSDIAVSVGSPLVGFAFFVYCGSKPIVSHDPAPIGVQA